MNNLQKGLELRESIISFDEFNWITVFLTSTDSYPCGFNGILHYLQIQLCANYLVPS